MRTTTITIMRTTTITTHDHEAKPAKSGQKAAKGDAAAAEGARPARRGGPE